MTTADALKPGVARAVTALLDLAQAITENELSIADLDAGCRLIVAEGHDMAVVCLTMMSMAVQRSARGRRGVRGVPDGEYTAAWSGYTLEFECQGETRYASTKRRGVRALNVPVRFKVVDGEVDEDSITKRHE